MIYVNGSPLNVTLFPDNTSQVWNVKPLELPGTNFIHIRWDYSHEGEFMQLAQLKMLADSMGFDSYLRISYLPYARQDKPVSNETTFALHAFAKLLNSLEFVTISIDDPHSALACQVIHGAYANYPIPEVYEVYKLTDSNCVCYPDKGAAEKYIPLYTLPYITGEKKRDPATGHITSYDIKQPPADTKVLIVDDICDGGMTFQVLTSSLKLGGIQEVNLFVTHGIFSKGLGPLKRAGINRIFTQDGEASEVQNQITYRRL